MKTDDRAHPTDEHPPAPEHPGEGPGESAGRPHRRDLLAASAGAALVTAAVLVGTAIQRSDGSLRVNWPPLLGTWDPRVGPGTPAALAVAVLVVAYGPGLAARLPWRALLATTFAAALAWTFSLALVDGWHWGVARRLTTKNEYLTVIDRFSDIGATLRGFSDHIVIGEPGNWPAHVAAIRRAPRSPSSGSTGSASAADRGPGSGAS